MIKRLMKNNIKFFSINFDLEKEFTDYQKNYNILNKKKENLIKKYNKDDLNNFIDLSFKYNNKELLNEYIEDLPLKYKLKYSFSNFKLSKYYFKIYYFQILVFLFYLSVFVFFMSKILENFELEKSLKYIKNFLKKNKKLIKKTDKNFSDVIGIDEYKEEVIDIVNFLKNPKSFLKSGAEIPKGILLVGDPGTGKTLLAKAIAGESDCNFIYKSASEFENKYIGVGSKNIKKLYREARENSPCIIFIDEIDTIANKRNVNGSGNSRDTLNQILIEMDGFKENNKIITIAATNHYNSLDTAILRPGRFDKIIHIPHPNLKGRLNLLKYFLKDIKIKEDIDIDFLSKKTYNFTGSDIKNLINVALIESIKKKKEIPDKYDFEEALDRITIGINNKSMKYDKNELFKTAIHEGGHTLVSLLTKGGNPVDKVTILPRGKALGFTKYVKDVEDFKITNQQLQAMIDSALGGRVAEEIFFGNKEITTGCSSDLDHATKLAYQFILNFGMYIKDNNYNLICQNKKDWSENYKYILDNQVQNILKESLKRTTELLTKNKNILKTIADELILKETLLRKDLEIILNN